MSAHHDNFKLWYKRLVENLYADPDAGFAILMITLPLLERYLRQKSAVLEGKLNSVFHKEFRKIFPVLRTHQMAKDFWQVYRNGLLHQVTLSQADRNLTTMPPGALSSAVSSVEVTPFGGFWVNPVKFAKDVFNAIEADFPTFEGAGSVHHPLPVIFVSSPLSNGTSNANPIQYVPPGTGRY